MNQKRISNLFIVISALVFFLFVFVLWVGEGGVEKAISFGKVFLLPRVLLGVFLSFLGISLLMRAKLNRKLRFYFLILIFILFGILPAFPLGRFATGLALHPSPVCTVIRPFQFIKFGREVPVVFSAIILFIGVLSLIGNKIFCGWVCPIGAIQEAVHRIPLPSRLKKKIPFGITNRIRVLVFMVFLILVFTLGKAIYDYFNPFEFLHWEFGFLTIFVFGVVIIASLFIYRPYCYFLCPLGLLTWILERISLFKVRLDKEKCTNCMVCVSDSPCPTVSAILEEKKSRPDCHACGRCIEVCPEDALRFGF